MVGGTTGPEYLLLRKKAEELRSKGYEVSLETPLDILPGFRADLVARKGDEVKVVEVKTRTALGAMPEIGELARRIDEKDGWSFGLVLVGEPEKLDVPDSVSPCAAANALQRIEQAENALVSGTPEAALLLAWAAIEAAARTALTTEGVTDKRVVTGSGVLHQTVFYGIVSRDEHERLKRLQAYRNAVAHGLDVEDFDEGVVREVIDAARRMVEVAAEPSARSARGLPLARKSLQPGSARGLPLARKSLQPGSARGLPLARKSLQPGSARGHPSREKSPIEWEEPPTTSSSSAAGARTGRSEPCRGSHERQHQPAILHRVSLRGPAPKDSVVEETRPERRTGSSGRSCRGRGGLVGRDRAGPATVDRRWCYRNQERGPKAERMAYPSP